MKALPPSLDRWRIETDRHMASIRLAERFLECDEEERRLVTDGWPFDAEWPYPDPKRLACNIGEVSSPLQRIIAGLVLDYLNGIIGFKEQLIALAARYRCCQLAGLDPRQVFEAVAAAVPPDSAMRLRAFLSRGDADRRPTAFGLVERVNSDGETELDLHL